MGPLALTVLALKNVSIADIECLLITQVLLVIAVVLPLIVTGRASGAILSGLGGIMGACRLIYLERTRA